MKKRKNWGQERDSHSLPQAQESSIHLGLKCPASMYFKLTDLIKVWLKSLNVAKIFLGLVINSFKKIVESWINLDRAETVGPCAVVTF